MNQTTTSSRVYGDWLQGFSTQERRSQQQKPHLDQGVFATRQSQRRLAGALNNTGALLHTVGDYTAALALYQEAVNTRMDMLRMDEVPTSHRATLAEEVFTSCNAVESRYRALLAEEAALRSSLECKPGHELPRDLEKNDLDLFQIKKSVHESPKRFSTPILVSQGISLDPTAAQSCDALGSAVTLYNMGLAHHRTGDFDKAQQLFEMSLTVVPTETQPGVAAAVLNNLAQLQYRSGDVKAAMDSLAEALRLEQRTCSPTTSATNQLKPTMDLEGCIIMTVSLMGRIYHDCGMPHKALELCQETLRLQRAALGDDHIEVTVTLYNIGVVMQFIPGRLDDSVEYCQWFIKSALLCGKLSDAKSNPQVAEALHVIGSILLRNGQVKKSYDILRLALSVGRNANGNENLSVADTLISLGRLCHDIGKFPEALEYYHEAAQINSSILGRDHEDVATILYLIGQAHQAHGDFDEALAMFEEVLRISRLVFGDHDSFVADVLGIIGNLFLELGDIDDAMANFADATRIRAQIPSEGFNNASSSFSLQVAPTMGIDSHPAAAAA